MEGMGTHGIGSEHLEQVARLDAPAGASGCERSARKRGCGFPRRNYCYPRAEAIA